MLWFTGLSGSGKSTVAKLVAEALHRRGWLTYTLDGDNLRHGLNRDLGFTDADRVENIRRVGEVAKLFADAGLVVLCSFISPFRAERETVRGLLEPGEFIEVFADAPVEESVRRDPKGLYARAMRGEIANVTSISSPYEPPETPKIHLRTAGMTPDEAAEAVLRHVTGLLEGGVGRAGPSAGVAKEEAGPGQPDPERRQPARRAAPGRAVVGRHRPGQAAAEGGEVAAHPRAPPSPDKTAVRQPPGRVSGRLPDARPAAARRGPARPRPPAPSRRRASRRGRRTRSRRTAPSPPPAAMPSIAPVRWEVAPLPEEP